MNRMRSYTAICVLLLLLSGCEPQTKSPATPIGNSAESTKSTLASTDVGQKELDSVADVIANSSAPSYLLIDIDLHKGTYGEQRLLDGLILLSRNTAFLTAIANSSLTDGNGNLVLAGALMEKSEIVSTLNHIGADHSSLMIDVNGDHVIDLGMWETPSGQKLLLFNQNAPGLDKSCLVADIHDKRSILSRCVDRKSPQAGPDVRVGSTLFETSKIPKCGSPSPIDNAISPPVGANPAADSERHARELEKQRDQAHSAGNEKLARALDKAAIAYHALANALRNFEKANPRMEADFNDVNEAAAEAIRREIEVGEILHSSFGSLGGAMPFPAHPERPSDPLDPLRPRPLPWLDRPSFKPLPGNDESGGHFADPRCKVGSLQNNFLDKEHCNGEDPLTCLARTSDPVKGITGGLCRTEPGPDGGQTIVCDHDKSPLDPSFPKPDYGPADVPLPRPVRDDQRIFKGYVEVTPLAGVIALRCRAAQGGICGGNP